MLSSRAGTPRILGITTCIAAAGLLISCSSGDTTTSRPGPHGTIAKTYSSWQDFAATSSGGSAAARPVVFVGIDGAAWWYIDRLIDEGRLPNIARIKKEGSHGILRSIPSFVSPPAWTTMMTGYLPGKSGIYTFGRWDLAKKEFTSVRAEDIRVPYVWDAASRAGRRVSVVNVPLTYPVSEVNGIMVGGQLTPITLVGKTTFATSHHTVKSNFVVQPQPKNYGMTGAALYDSLNAFYFMLYDTVDDHIGRADSVTLRVTSRLPTDEPPLEMGTYRFATDEYSPWIRIRHDNEGRIQDAFTKMICVTDDRGGFDIRNTVTILRIESQYTYPKELAAELEREFNFYVPTTFLPPEILPRTAVEGAAYLRFFYDYDDWDLSIFVFTQSDNAHHTTGFGDIAGEVYEHIDSAIGEIMASMPPNATLVIASDHGFDAFKYGVDLNRALSNLGLLEWTEDGTIDFENTLVFHNLYHLYFNPDLMTRVEFSRRGIEAGNNFAESLIDHVISHASKIHSDEFGRDFELEFHRMPDGTLIGDAPAMWVHGSYDDYTVEFWNIRQARDRAVWEFSDDRARGWWHRRDGIYMMWGDDIRAGHDAGVRDIQDIAPTMAFLLGVPIAPDMDGKVIFDALRPDRLAGRETYTVTAYRDLPRIVFGDAGEREDLEKRLKALGYVQ